jgi:hypothetical protein
MLRRSILALAPFALVVFAAAPASAETLQPWWHVTTGSRPSYLPPPCHAVPAGTGEYADSECEEAAKPKGSGDFERGKGQIVVALANLGDAPTSTTACEKVAIEETGKYKNAACTEAEPGGKGEYEIDQTPVVISDKLPEGLRATSIAGVVGQYTQLTCHPAKLDCEYDAPVAPYAQLEVRIGVDVESAKECEPSDLGACETNEVGVSGGGALPTSVKRPVIVNKSPVPFGLSNYELAVEEAGGAPDTQAGSHPFQTVVTTTLNQTVGGVNPGLGQYEVQPAAQAKDLRTVLPAGLVGNPTPFPQCTLAQFLTFINAYENLCPASTVMGVAIDKFDEPGTLGLTKISVPIFNLEPQTGEPARFGYEPTPQTPIYIGAAVRSGQDYAIEAPVDNITQIIGFVGQETIFWGVPGDPRHNSSRGAGCLFPESPGSECQPLVENHPPPFFELPTSCAAPLWSSTRGDSWLEPLEVAAMPTLATYELPALDGCNRLPFRPSIVATPDGTAASSPTGMTVDVHNPQQESLNAEGLGEADVKDITVALPEGVAVNPSDGDGLAACDEGLAGFEIGHGVQGSGFEEFNPKFEPGVKTPLFEPRLYNPATGQDEPSLCPNAAKIGEAVIKTPLLKNPVKGFVYLATQNTNPFGSLLAMYLVAEDPESGVVIKATGQVHLTETGQLVTTFENNPQAPFEDAELHFFGGERAPLATPAHCGAYTTTASLTPWSLEAGEAPRTLSSTFDITSGPKTLAQPEGSPCPGASLPFNPSLTGGATNIQAGAFSPLTGTFSREDGEQSMAQLQFHLPPGLSGLLSSVKLCGEEQANAGTCGPESLIGETTVSAGVGSDPISVRGGRVYITEKYHGAPFGISVVDPVKAGPFDLEHDTSNPNQDPACDCIVVRAKLEIDPVTTAVTITSNSESEGYAIPHMIDGIPVQIKKVNFLTTRSGFQFNPTNCEKMAVTGTITSSEGVSRPVAVPFQVTNCATLAFKPGFSVSTSGKTSRARGASLHVKLTYPKAPFGSQANVKSVKVDLPRQLPSRLTTLQKACSAAQFATNPAGCPADSRVGSARAITPLVPVPLEGPAYFVSYGAAKFPELVIVLQGYGITADLHGETFINEKTGITSSTFRTVPDQPVESFELTLPEGPYSALAANGNLCTSKLVMPTAFTAQNGDVIHQSTKISVSGCAKHKKTKKHKKSKGKTKHKK